MSWNITIIKAWFQATCQRLLTTKQINELVLYYVVHVLPHCMLDNALFTGLIPPYQHDRKLVVYQSQDHINTVERLPVILHCNRRFLDMFKSLRPAHFMFFARTFTSDQYVHFILSTCESTNKPLKTGIHLLLPSTAIPIWNLFCQYCSSQSLRLVVRFYEIYLRLYHVTGLTQVATWPHVTRS